MTVLPVGCSEKCRFCYGVNIVVNAKSQCFQTPDVKRWFIVKGPGESRWSACEIFSADLARLKPGYKLRGPFKNLMHCLIASSCKSD